MEMNYSQLHFDAQAFITFKTKIRGKGIIVTYTQLLFICSKFCGQFKLKLILQYPTWFV